MSTTFVGLSRSIWYVTIGTFDKIFAVLSSLAEFVFLCVGIRFIYSTRTAPCEYHERKLITIAIVCEMLFSTLLHVIKYVPNEYRAKANKLFSFDFC